MASNFCPNCLRDTDNIFDYTVGMKICSECGFLLDEFDQTGETPELPDDSSIESTNQNQENFPANISEPPNVRFVKAPKKGLKLIGVMANKLDLGEALKDRAIEIFNMVDVLRTCRGRSMNSIVAACLFIACREVKLSRTLKEISDVANGASKKGINRAIEAIKKRLEVETWTVQPAQLVRRFCSKLGMQNQAIKAVQEALQKTQELDIRRSPQSVLAVIIYMVIQLSNEQVPIKEIANATEVTELTIKKSYKDISLKASKLIPDWYASDEDIEKIPDP
ncbi:hypothetical protein PTKIN_Ptkin08bG0066100 [Pterospermum kingtungense]